MNQDTARGFALERNWPQKVVMPIPSGGFGWRFPHLLWAARNCGSPRHWEERGRLAFGFYDAIDTAQFREWLTACAIDWRCPPEWPQIAPPPPVGAVVKTPLSSSPDPDEMSDWLRGALRRGHAKRIIGAYLKANRGPHSRHGNPMMAAIDELAATRPDLDPAQRAPLVRALYEWTMRNHGQWFSQRLNAHERNQ